MFDESTLTFKKGSLVLFQTARSNGAEVLSLGRVTQIRIDDHEAQIQPLLLNGRSEQEELLVPFPRIVDAQMYFRGLS